MIVTILIENTKTHDNVGLTAEHGLSLLISTGQKTILFDTGASGAFSDNAEKLGIDLGTVDAVVLSHHHYDHGGGLDHFFALNPHAEVYLKNPPEGECYFKASPQPNRCIGLGRDLFIIHAGRFKYIDQFTEILPGVYLFPAISSTYPKPKGNSSLYIKTGNNWNVDPFEHELILGIRETQTLTIFTGCAHNGVLNMIDTVTTTFSSIPVEAVIGGFHLINLPSGISPADPETDIRSIAEKIRLHPVGMIYTGHCTGDRAYAILKSVLGEKLQHLHTGMVLQI